MVITIIVAAATADVAFVIIVVLFNWSRIRFIRVKCYTYHASIS